MGASKLSPARPKVETVDLIEFDDPADIPAFASESEEADWWDTHAPSERYLELVGEATDDGLPPPRPRTTPLSIRFDPATIRRLKAVAWRKNKGYQTLLKEFVCERLYEEEKREGILPG